MQPDKPNTQAPVQFRPHVTSSILVELPPAPKLESPILRQRAAEFELGDMRINVEAGGLRRVPLVRPMAVVGDAMKAMLVAALVLLVFNSHGLNTWANNLPTSRTAEVLTGASQTWDDWMTAIGIAGAMESARDTVALLREETWPEPSVNPAPGQPAPDQPATQLDRISPMERDFERPNGAEKASLRR